jgi:uncharacterized protein (DUF1330 family)
LAVYFIANIRINDPEEYNKYLAKADEIFRKYNGEYLAVDGSPLVLEGKWDYTRAVLIKFPGRDDFYRWYRSAEYQEILKHRLSAAHCDTILITDK